MAKWIILPNSVKFVLLISKSFVYYAQKDIDKKITTHYNAVISSRDKGAFLKKFFFFIRGGSYETFSRSFIMSRSRS